MKNYICDDDYKPLIPNGTYTAQCIKYDNKFVLGKTRKLFLNFVILSEGDYHGKKIFQAFNMPYNGRIKTGSKYYKTWVKVNGWKQPSRNSKMSPRLFLNKVYTVKTRTAKPLYNKDEPMPKSFWYTVVDEILDIDTS